MSNISEQLKQRRFKKSYRYGTQRICEPQETWDRISPLFPSFGITRVADITWLDCIGIPVYVSFRPNSRTNAQSNGKGLTPLQANVSAAMESIECWHGEELRTADLLAPYSELRDNNLLSYNPHTLSINPDGFFCDTLPIEWIACQDITNKVDTYLPREVVNLDFSLQQSAALPCFRSDTNGLASGNSLLEATLHGLCEVIERDAHTKYISNSARTKTRRIVAIETIDSAIGQELIERCRKAGFEIYVEEVSSEIGVPVFLVSIVSDDHFGLLQGCGCHPNRETALIRALTEAVQSRATIISASRDDIHLMSYYTPNNSISKTRLAQLTQEGKGLIDYNSVPTADTDYIEEDLQTIIDRLQEKMGVPVLMTDLTDERFQISVVKVVTPLLKSPAVGSANISSRQAPVSTTRAKSIELQGEQ